MYLLISALSVFFQVVYYMLFARIILSYFPGVHNTRIGVFLYTMTEPILAPFRNMLRKSPLGGGMMLDFSPIIAFLVLDIVKKLLISFLLMF